MLSKGVESYSEFAAELDDGEFLTDAELFTQIMKCLKQSYGVTALHDLTRPQKLDLAKKLHYDFRSSNGQSAVYWLCLNMMWMPCSHFRPSIFDN